MNKNRGLMPLTAVLMLSGGLMLAGCNNDETQQSAQQQAPEVGIVTLKTQPLNITTELPGRTNAYRIAEVRPQVGGIILKRNFTEGSDVQAGESLYQIDPATYQATYNSAKASLAQAQASAEIARLTVSRYKPLLGTSYISKQDYDEAVADSRQADATVQSARASLENAQINLNYTKVSAPISGRIGKSTVTEGALVSAAQATALTTVQLLDPIYVDVTQSSNDFLKLKKDWESGILKQSEGKASVRLLLENGAEYQHDGTLEFSDVTVDETTGSITLRAVFPNPQHDLLPGMFVRARLDSGINNNALLVPQKGITRNQRGEATALVVGKDDKVEQRILTTVQTVGDQWLVSSGLQEGDRVIVNGLQKVRPGVPVKAAEVTPENIPSQQTQSEPEKS